MNPSDMQDFVQLFNNGDRAAFEIIYKRLSPDLFTFTKRIIGIREEAEDVVAETFYKLWTMPKNFETVQHINAFLHITSRNACFDRMRHSKLEIAKREIVLQNILASYESTEAGTELAELLLNRIYLEMEKLPAKSREVIKLSYIEDLKNGEIARRLGTNEKTIRNQKTNALKRLRIAILSKLKS